jgi:hypothetical protein
MFSFDQTSVASERNNMLWLSGVPDCCGMSEGNSQESLVEPRTHQNLTEENRMSKVWEHYHQAARHHERAAYTFSTQKVS